MPVTPEKVDILKDIVLPSAIAIIMFGMGLSLTIKDFKRVFLIPKAVVVGLLNQLILLPLVAFCLIELFGLTGGLALGLVIISVCPGGATSNLITHVAKGDTALSVTLTAIATVITVFTIPFIVDIGMGRYMKESGVVQMPVLKTIIKLFGMTILPVLLGMIIKKYNDNLATKVDKPVRIASIVIFVLILLGLILKSRKDIISYFETAGIVALILNLVTISLGYFSAKLIKLDRKKAVTVSIESGIQNGTLALAVVTFIPNNTNEMNVFPAVYSLIMFFTGAFIMWYFGRKKA